MRQTERFGPCPVLRFCIWATVGQPLRTALQGRRGGGVVVYQYTRKKLAKIPQNTQKLSKYTQVYFQVYFIPEIQRK